MLFIYFIGHMLVKVYKGGAGKENLASA